MTKIQKLVQMEEAYDVLVFISQVSIIIQWYVLDKHQFIIIQSIIAFFFQLTLWYLTNNGLKYYN